MSSRTSGILSGMRQRRAERKKPKRFVALKKVALDSNQQSSISTAQANLLKHPITQKHIGRSSAAFTVAMVFHALIAIFIGFFVIVDQIEQERETFDVSMIREEAKTKRRFRRREALKFESKQQEQKPVFRQPVRTNTELPSKDVFTIPDGTDTGVDLVEPDINEGPAVINVDRNFVQPSTTIEPETTAPAFELKREAPPTMLEKLDTPLPDSDLGMGNIEITAEKGIEIPTYKIRVEPKYPDTAKKAEKEGTVILAATIDEKGIPKDIVPVTSLGFGLEEAAIGALKKTTFRPATKGGKPISLENVQIPYEFKLKDS